MNRFSQLYEEASGGAGAGGGGGGGGNAGGAGAGGGASGSLLSGQGASGAGSGQAGDGGGASGAGPSGVGPSGAAGAGGAAGTSAPWFVGLYGSDGKINAKAFDALPDHLKSHKATFSKYQTVEALLGGMGNLANLAGKKGLEPLSKDAPAELQAERTALMRKLNNVPEKPEGYGIKKPDGMPDTMWDGEYVNGVSGILHKHNASPELVAELMKFDSEAAMKKMSGSEAQTAQALEAQRTALKDEFGVKFAEKIALATRAARTLGLDPENNPMFRTAEGVRAMLKVSEMVSEDKLVSGEGAGGNFGGDDRAKALDIVNNEANPLHKAFHDADHPQHAHAVEQRSMFNRRYHEAQKRRS